MKLIENLKTFLFGAPTPPPHVAEYLAAAERVSAAADKVAVDYDPLEALAKDMRNGVIGKHKKHASKKAAV